MSERESDLLDETQELIAGLESHSDPAVGEQVRALLERIDAVHRTALTHLMNAIQALAGDAFVNRLAADPAVRLLLMSYDLLAVDRRLLTEEALDVVRGHLHSHGIDVELVDVVGSVVYARVHGVDESGAELDAVRRDLEEALRANLLGFQELVLGGRDAAASRGGLVQLGGVRRVQQPVYRYALASGELDPGAIRAVEIDGQSILIVNIEGELYAVGNRCGDSPLPLQFGTLEGEILRCSWHGCRYDVRTGKRLDGDERLAVFPVAERDGEILVAVGVEPARAV